MQTRSAFSPTLPFTGTHLQDSLYINTYGESLSAAGMKDHTWRGPRFYHLVQLFGLTQGLVGATVEAGCFRGLSSLLLCQYERMTQPDFDGSTHYIVDSFEGLSRPTDEDGEHAKSRHESGAFTGTSVEHVRNTLKDFPAVSITKGWIPDALEGLPEQDYRFVHIDVDLYAPTIDCLRYFYPRLVSHGVIVCDDYGPWPGGEWAGCAIAMREFAKEQDTTFVPLNTGNAFLIKR